MALNLSVEGSFETAVTDDSSNLASLSSTPPTTIADSSSVHSASPKRDVVHVAIDPAPVDLPIDTPPVEADAAVLVADAEPGPPAAESPSTIRPRRSRASLPVYNLAQLSGTAGHGKRRAKGDIVADRRRTMSGGRLSTGSVATSKSLNAVHSGVDASDLSRSLSSLDSSRTRRQKNHESPARRASARLSGPSQPTGLTSKITSLSKRSRKAVDKGVTAMSRELRRLQDTKEFSGIDDKPVVHTVWSNGKYVDLKAQERERKKAKKEEEEAVEEQEEEAPEPIANSRKRRVKKYVDKGLYAGQEAPIDIFKGLTPTEKKQLAQLPELIPSGRVNKTMPLPMFAGLRLLIQGRDFKLPYHVCNPMPPKQPKPNEWRKMTKNRFIGESKDYWRKSPHFHDYSSKCVCKPEDGCGESCQNRIMLYECDELNCNVGKQYCSNRAFATLTARRNKGGQYRVGVEVVKTSDRGHGVRSNRCFRPGQIIMEYAGEIITEDECERRMTEEYKDNECYYLMSFDQNMIIDATSGSIARFVNHSCNPNCRMIKWIVSGQPRMALFAGDNPIQTGDELTYDYNFDPFSAKNVQKCLCGEPNCRGVLGPKPREVKPPKADLKNAVKAKVKAGKRKLKELIGDDGDAAQSKTKKRKIQPATGVKRSLSSKVAKSAATALKKVTTKKTTMVKAKSSVIKSPAAKAKSPAKRRASTGAILKKTTTATRIIQTYGKTASSPRGRTSSTSSVTLVTKGRASPATKRGVTKKATPVKTIKAKNPASLSKASTSKRTSALDIIAKVTSPRKAIELSRGSEIRVVQEE